MALRPTTNLVVPPELMLPKKAQRERFLYVYTGAYIGTPTVFMTKLWASVFFPSVVADPKFGSARPRFAADELAKIVPAGYLRVEKIKTGTDSFFTASVPLFAFAKHSTSTIANFLNGVMRNHRALKEMPDLGPDHIGELRDFQEMMTAPLEQNADGIQDQVIPAARVIQAMKGDMAMTAALTACLRQVRIQTKGSMSIIFADFKIAKDEAQQLTTTPWQELRDIDIYPLLLHWCTAGWGARGRAPTASFSVSKIAFSLPANHVEEARVNADGLSIDPEGRPVFLPRSVDKSQTLTYEDAYTQAGARDDGSFSLIDINEGAAAMESGKEVKVRLPVNMVVSVDWLNNKYSYTDGKGMLKVMDLTRFRTADMSHIRTLLEERKVTDETLAWFFNLADAVGVERADFVPLASDVEGVDDAYKADFYSDKVKDVVQWMNVASAAFMAQEGAQYVTYADLGGTSWAPFKAVNRWLTKVAAAVTNNIGVAYNKYTVTTVASQFAWLLLVTKYAPKIIEVRAADVTKRSAAIEQQINGGIDPNWKMPSVPLVGKPLLEGGFLPHQQKVENILRNDPDTAILPVQAGGGKSPLLLVDVLMQFKKGQNAPYLVLCPGHLVPNYVKEAVFFTDGKLNVIPVTNPAIRQNGWKRLQQIFEAMPRNTVVVVDLDYSLSFRARNVSYGTTPTTIFPVIDFLRQFRFGYVAIDEAHRIKGSSLRNQSVMALVSDIPKKRLASGTFCYDSPSDLARTVGALDPTIFGTREEFNSKYGEEFRGDRVTKWKLGADLAIMNKIKQHVVVAQAMRKEWAAFLPTRIEWTGAVNLTHAQQAVYEDILNETIEKIQEDAKTNAALKKFLTKGQGGADEEPDETGHDSKESSDADEEEGEDLAGALNAHLERLETFLVAPGRDILGDKLLQGDDRLSPKVAMVYDRIRLHLFGGETDQQDANGEWHKAPYGPFPGKVLVFCNSHKAADEIFESAPPDLKKLGVRYHAETKVEALTQMEKDPNKKWMVGIVKSMEEGLNLQFASRIIRVSNPWNPGALEQSNSRIERPEFKKAETRPSIFMDAIVANRTYDITKQARLIAKVIAAAKFDNTDSPSYQKIPDVEVVPMTLDSIRQFNTWEGDGTPENPGLLQYMQANRVYVAVRTKDYADYKAAYIAKHGNTPVMVPLVAAPTPPDAKLLKVVPYVPGIGVYKEQDLGLKRLDEYLNITVNDSSDEDEEDEVEEKDDGSAGKLMTPEEIEYQKKREQLKEHPVHTEFGEGFIYSVANKGPFVQIELLNGYRVRLRKSQVFLITRTLTNNKDIRNAINKAIGLPVQENPVSVPADFWKPSSYLQKQQIQQQKEQEQKEALQKQQKQNLKKAKEKSVELYVFVANGYIGIDYLMDEDNETASKMLQANGFRPVAPYYYSKVRNSTALNNQMKLWKEKGLMVDTQMMKLGVREAFIEMYNLLKSGKVASDRDTYRVATQQKMVNFYRMENKPSNSPDTFKPYPILQDGAAYIALPANQASSKTAMKFKRPAFSWKKSDPALTYFGTMPQVVAKLKELVAEGLHVSNIKDLEQQLAKMRASKFQGRDPKGDSGM